MPRIYRFAVAFACWAIPSLIAALFAMCALHKLPSLSFFIISLPIGCLGYFRAPLILKWLGKET